MIKDISEIYKKSEKIQKEFFENCTIEEKIDAHYITIEISSKDKLKFYKSDKKEIDKVDLIVNDMWGKLLNDWLYIMFSNKEYMEHHIGYKFSMFYLPTSKPLQTVYKKGIRYIISRIEFNKKQYNINEFINSIKYDKTKYLIVEHYKNLKCVDGEKYPLDKRYCLFDDVSVIYRYKKLIYQKDYTKHIDINKSKAPYEYILIDFLKFMKNRNIKTYISYTSEVCALFNNYILNFFDKNKILKNISEKDLEPSYLGEKPKINYEYIPSILTKTICQSDKLYENIFKILIVNLRKYKNYKNCILLSKKQCEEWHQLVNKIQIQCLTI